MSKKINQFNSTLTTPNNETLSHASEVVSSKPSRYSKSEVKILLMGILGKLSVLFFLICLAPFISLFLHKEPTLSTSLIYWAMFGIAISSLLGIISYGYLVIKQITDIESWNGLQYKKVLHRREYE